MTELHEKKIRDLLSKSNKVADFEHVTGIENILKEWAIAIVRENRRIQKMAFNAVSKEIKKQFKQDYNPDPSVLEDDEIVKFLIDRFEITEEDLR